MIFRRITGFGMISGYWDVARSMENDSTSMLKAGPNL